MIEFWVNDDEMVLYDLDLWWADRVCVVDDVDVLKTMLLYGFGFDVLCDGVCLGEVCCEL